MRKLLINLLAPALLLTAVTVASSQQPNPGTKPEPKPAPAKDKDAAAKSQLEEMLEIALKNNPDLKVAQAKAFEADAELNRARLAVTQKVVVLYNDIEAARANVKNAQQQLARVRELRQQNLAGQGTVDEAEAKLVQAKIELAKLEAEVPYLLGQPNAKRRGDMEPQSTSTINKSMGEKLHAALDKGPMTIAITKGWGPEDLLNFCRDKYGMEINFLIKDKNLTFPESDTGVRLDDVSFGAVLQWTEDSLPKHCFVVRDYGLVLMRRDQVPPDALLLNDFWKAKQKEAPKAKEEKK